MLVNVPLREGGGWKIHPMKLGPNLATNTCFPFRILFAMENFISEMGLHLLSSSHVFVLQRIVCKIPILNVRTVHEFVSPYRKLIEIALKYPLFGLKLQVFLPSLLPSRKPQVQCSQFVSIKSSQLQHNFRFCCFVTLP